MIIIFHTAELGKYIGWNELQRIKHNCAPYRDRTGTVDPTKWFYGQFADHGLIFIYQEPKENTSAAYRFPWMKVIVNFSKLLQEAEHVELPNYYDVGDVLQLFEAYMEAACLEQRHLEQPAEIEDGEQYQVNRMGLYVQRIDCTMQLTGLSQNAINGYIHIYNHSNRKQFPRPRPRGFRNYNIHGNYEKGHRSGSAYFASNDVGVNIYDKRQQMLNVNKSLVEQGKEPKYTSNDIAAATGVLRIEFQCYKGALSYRLHKIKPPGFTRRTLENVLDSRISEDIILSNLKRLAWTEPHIRTIEARKNILNSNSKSKTRLLEIIKKNQPKGMSIDRVKELCSEPDKFQADLRKIREMGFNPITLSKNKMAYKLENLYNLLQEQIGNQYQLIVSDKNELDEEIAPSGDVSIFDEYENELDKLLDDGN